MASFINLVRETLLTAQAPRRPSTIPSFLVPALSPLTHTFSTTPTTAARHRGDRSKNRGVSPMRRTGPAKRQILSVTPDRLPKPILDPSLRSGVQVDPDHGLWAFFNADRTLFATPEYNHSHGRAWMVSELRKKHWNDLWCLWWVCVRERNRLSTEEYARKEHEGRTYGEAEAEERDGEIRATMKAIKRVLTERWYAWEDARKLAKTDERVNLYPKRGQPGLASKRKSAPRPGMVTEEIPETPTPTGTSVTA